MTARPFQALLQAAFDLWLSDSPEVRADCAALAGRSIAVSVTDLGIDLSLRPHATGIAVSLDVDDAPDVRIRARTGELLRLARGAAGVGELSISGDAAVAESARDLFRAARFDPDERLAALVGDVPAHQLGRLFRGVAAFGRDTAGAVGDMASEYLRFETRMLPTRHEVGDFIDAVDALRDDVERAAARLARVSAARDDGRRNAR